MTPIFARFRYHHNPLEVVYIDIGLILHFETAKGGGTSVATRTGLEYTIHETPDEAAASIAQARKEARTSADTGGAK